VSRELRYVAALAALLAVAGVALALTAGGDDEKAAAGLTVERGVGPTGLPELLATVTGDAAPPSGARSVTLTCLDHRGGTVTAGRYRWPLETDGPDPGSHIHQPTSGPELARIARCRLGTRPPLTARLSLR